MSLKEELKMETEFSSLGQEALLSISRTQSILDSLFSSTFSEYKITPSQFNVLRILKGNSAEDGMSCSNIGSRMINRDSDMTRLLDKLEKKKYIKRHRTIEDRRKILIKITAQGLLLLDKLNPVLKNIEKNSTQHMSNDKLKMLLKLLETIRGPYKNI
jgi:DNA-binding MarR family transcriptional regulator